MTLNFAPARDAKLMLTTTTLGFAQTLAPLTPFDTPKPLVNSPLGVLTICYLEYKFKI